MRFRPENGQRSRRNPSTANAPAASDRVRPRDAQVLRLQREAGNAAVSGLAVQRDDKYKMSPDSLQDYDSLYNVPQTLTPQKIEYAQKKARDDKQAAVDARFGGARTPALPGENVEAYRARMAEMVEEGRRGYADLNPEEAAESQSKYRPEKKRGFFSRLFRRGR